MTIKRKQELTERWAEQEETLTATTDAVKRAYHSMVIAYEYWLQYTPDLDLRASHRSSYENAKAHWEALSIEMVIQQKRRDHILREIESLA